MSRKKLHPSEAELRESAKLAWLDELDPFHSRTPVDEVPEGWATLTELAEYKNIPVTTMNSRMTKELNAGTVQRKKFRVKAGNGVVNTWHYYKNET